MDMETILNELKNLDLDAYREIIAYCESRSTGTEGIPAVIGLDDLTRPDEPVYQGAAMDEKMHEKMALDALVFTWLYTEVEGRDPHYPCIAPAMSALAEKSFLIPEGEEAPVQSSLEGIGWDDGFDTAFSQCRRPGYEDAGDVPQPGQRRLHPGGELP